MPDSITRKEQAMRTRMSLLNAALLLFQERGVTNVKVTDICEEAGVSVGAFYHHFPSKEDLIERSYQGMPPRSWRASARESPARSTATS